MPAVQFLAAARPATAAPSTAAVLLWAVLIATAVAVAYSASVRRHPYRPCRTCGTSGRQHSALFPRAFRACSRCGGTGRELRPFARTPGSRR